MAQPTAREDLNKVAPQNNFATPELLDKVRGVESTNQHIDPKTKRLTRSPTGAEGAYQILPSTQKRPGYGVPPVRNRTEVEHRRFAGDYLNALSRKYGDDAKAVVAYNQGPGTVDRAVREANAAGTTWYAALEKKEGRDYLVKVLGAGAVPVLAAAPAQALAPASTLNMSRPVTVNPNMRAQVERIREQRASAQSAPGVAPVDKVSALTPIQQSGVDKVGAGFQAALGFSMLGASGRGLPTAEEGEADEETAEVTDEPSAKQALSSLRGLPTLDAFAAQRQAQPVQMADGGSLDDLGDDVGVGYNPVNDSTQNMSAASQTPQAPQIKLRRASASKSMGNMGDIGDMGDMSKKSKEKTPKGTARQQLEELQYKTGLTSAVIKDKLRGLGEDTFGAPTLTSSRGKLTRGPLAVASFDTGGEAKKDSVGVAAKLLDTFNEYGKKAEEYGLKARDFMVENMISPTDIATMVLKVKRMVPVGALTYSGGLNEGEDEQIAKMREAARQQSALPVPRANGSPQTGETGAAYGNPTTLAQGEKMRARRALEQVKRVDQQRKDDMLSKGRMERYDPAGISQNPYKESDTSGPQTLDEAAGLDSKVDRSTFLPYSEKEGWHVPAVAADLMKLATASDPRYSHLMRPEEAMPLSANLLGGGFGASMATKAAGPGTLGMFIGPSSRMWRKKAIVQAEKMEAEGRTPEEIWNSTFSARAPWDNQWRQRISDISMNMTGEKIPHENPLAVAGDRAVAPFVNTYKDLKNLVKTGSIDPWIYDPLNYSARGKRYEDRPKLGPKDVPLTEQVSWPRLQNAYPGLLESMVIHSDREINPKSGYHDQRQVLTEVAPGNFKNLTRSKVGLGKKMYEPAGLFASRLKPGEGPWDAKSVLAHETMHRIQSDEGFGLGSSPEWAVYQNPDRYAAARHQYQLDVPPPSATDKFLEKHKVLKSVLPSTKREKALRKVDYNAAYNTYERVGGEAEARLVQAEKNMSQDALDKQYPYDPKYFKEQTGVDISTVFRKEGSPEEGERSMGDRLKGYGETAASLLSGLGASVPAGYSGLVELARTRDPEKAAEEVRRRQAAMTYEPRTASGKKSTESAAALLENLSIPAQYVGGKAFEATGESPLAGAAAETLLDPLNFIPGAKAIKGFPKAVKEAAFAAYGPGATASLMNTWHGSPHRFPLTKNNPLGEFDPMKSGTGEGAQAYGVGAGYLAENPGVANEYARKLAHQKSVDVVEDRGGLMIDGIFKPIKSFDGAYTNQEYRVLREIAENGPDDVLAKLKAHVDKVPVGHPLRAIRERVAAKTSEIVSKNRGRNISVVDDVYAPDIPPNLYKVDLPDEQIAKMLDWDKPISRQSEEVKAAIRKIGGMSGTDVQGWYGWRAKVLGSERAASDELRAAGIPGIRYLDQGSRSGGKGTSNFVVFDPAHMNIIERNGLTLEQARRNEGTYDLAKDDINKAKGGAVSAARLLEDMPRTQPEVTGVNRLVDWVAQRLPANKFPTSARTLLETVQGKRDPITEANFSPAELDVMRQLITQKGGNTGDVQYADYVKLQKQLQKQGGGLAMSITPSLLSMGDPIGNVQTTLGRFQYARDAKGNLTLQDTYDFNPPPQGSVNQEQYTGQYGYLFSPYGLIRSYAGEKIPPGHGRTININLGK